MAPRVHEPRGEAAQVRGAAPLDGTRHERVLEVATPFLGEVAGAWGDWTPVKDRSPLFPEPKDEDDPWQFLNFRVG